MQPVTNYLARLPAEMHYNIAEQCDSLADAVVYMQAVCGGDIPDSVRRSLHRSGLWSRTIEAAHRVRPSASESSESRREVTRVFGKVGTENTCMAVGFLSQGTVWLSATIVNVARSVEPGFQAHASLGGLVKLQFTGFAVLVGGLVMSGVLGRLAVVPGLRRVAYSGGEYCAATRLAADTSYLLTFRDRHGLRCRPALAATAMAATLSACAAVLGIGLAHIGLQMTPAVTGVSGTVAALLMAADVAAFGLGCKFAIRIIVKEWAAVRRDFGLSCGDGYRAILQQLDATMRARGAV
jgi:hypothetical protein